MKSVQFAEPESTAAPELLRLELVPRAEKVAVTAADAGDSGAAPEAVLLTLQSGSFLARVGQHPLAYDSLINKDQADRGGMVTLGLGGRTRIKGFGVYSNLRSGYQQMLGSDRASYGFNGLVVEHQLPTSGTEAVRLVAGWLSGVATAYGTGQDSPRHAGDAWSVAADTELLEKRLRLELEYAGSRYDWKRTGGGAAMTVNVPSRFEDQTGQALSFTSELRSIESSPLSWHLGTEFDQVTPWFGSLANPGLTRDRRRLRTYGALSAGEWRFDLSLEQQQSNLEADREKPTVQTDKGQFTAEWTPSALFDGSFTGKPSFRLAADYGRREQMDALSAIESDDTQVRTMGLMLQTEFAHAGGTWGVRAKGERPLGLSDADAGNREQKLVLEFYGDMAAASLKPAVSWRRKRDALNELTDEHWHAGLSSSDISLRDTLKARVHLAFQHRSRSDTGRIDDGFSLGANIEWQLQDPSPGRDGLRLAVSGSYLGGDRDLNAPTAGDDYGFMVSLSSGQSP